MRILYISHKPIYPKLDGGCVAMANFLDLLLSQNHEVKHLAIGTNKHVFNRQNYPSDIADKTGVESIFINTDINTTKAIKSLFAHKSYNVDRFYNEEMKAKIYAILNSLEFDAVILESLFSTPYIDTIRKHFNGKIYLRAHNVEFHIWEDLTTNCSNWLKKAYLKKLTKDIKQYELATIQQLDGIMTISEADELFLKNATTIPVKTIPFSVTPNETVKNDYSSSNLFHLGGLDWEPNRQAVERLMRLFPSIKAQLPTIELTLIGKETDNLQINTASIYAKGFVDELNEFVINSGVLVSPISSGSGIRIKILEMMGIGIPVITSKKGAQGINHEGKKCIFIAETDEEFIEACVNLSEDHALRKELGTNAKNYISTYHLPETVAKHLDEFLQST